MSAPSEVPPDDQALDLVGVAIADDGCRLWAAETGHGTPPGSVPWRAGLWDMFGDLASMLSEHIRVVRWDNWMEIGKGDAT